MPAPFYNAIKGTTAGTPGTGAFTPNAASSGFRAWSVVPSWIGLVRYEDGSAWELSYGYWNGTTISRPAAGFFDSSSGSQLSLTSAATAAMVADGGEIMSHLGTTAWCSWRVGAGQTAAATHGTATPTATGSAAAGTIATTNYLTEQQRLQLTSATTANAQAGWSSTTATAPVSTSAGRGGFEMTARWGASGLPTGPRLMIGMLGTTFVGSTAEPSALVANVAAFAKDSTDTNIQLLVNSNAGSGTKTDTGIPLTANGWYESCVWCEPGSNKVFGLLVRLDTGDIWYGSTTTDVPANGSILFPQLLGGLNGTNTGTAFVMNLQTMVLRVGA